MSQQYYRPPVRQVVAQRARPLSSRPTGRSRGMRFLIALGVAAFALISFFGSKSYNPVTGEDQYVNITAEQEIALGLQAAPEMAQQFGGLDPDTQAQAVVDAVGQHVVDNSVASQTVYPYEFHLLADPETVNAFAGRSSSRRPCLTAWRPRGSWRACWATKSGTSSPGTARSASPNSNWPRA
jgi:hypothetical protein